MLNTLPLRVTIVGTGYVGLTTAVALAYIGHDVTGIDKDLTKIRLLESGVSPIHEAHIEDLLRLNDRTLRFDTNLKKAVAKSEVVIIAVGTPPKSNGEANTQYVEDAAEEIAQSISDDQRIVVVVKSTVPIGSNHRVESVMTRILQKRGIKAEISFASNPEFLREGRALHDTFYPDRIVIGAISEHAIHTLSQLYRPLLEQIFTEPLHIPRPHNFPRPALVTTDIVSAEMIKYAANAFLATKISFINEIGGLCEKVGADVTEVSRGMGLDTRIGSRFLNAGLGWGGSCFPKDTQALQSIAAEYGYTLPIIEAAREINERQQLVAIEKLQRVLHVLRGRTITILGLAFKSGTDDVRDSASITVIRALIDRGAHVRAQDPIALKKAKQTLGDIDIDWYEEAMAACMDSDAVIIATEWEEYRHLEWSSIANNMRNKIIIDGRNLLNPSEMRGLGFTYVGVGTPEASFLPRNGR